MSAPLLLLLAPSLLAVLIFTGLRRWPRAAGVSGFLGATLIALLLATAGLEPDPMATPLIAGNEFTFLGRSLLLSEGVRRLLLLIYVAAALLFLLSARWSQGPDFVPAGLAVLAPLAFAMMVTPLAFGVVALLLAAALLAALVQGQRPGSTLASLRYLVLTALAVPALLIAGWLLDSQQFALAGVIWRLFLLGATLLLAGFPFHIWVRPLLNEARPLTAVFVLAPVQLGVLTFVWRWMQQNSQLLLNTQLGAVLGWSGAATALIAAFLAYGARDPRRYLGSLVLADMGATLICLAQGVAGIEQAWALLLLRFGALLIAATGLQWSAQRAGVDASLVESQHLAQHPLAAAFVVYGALSLIGLPLTPGFAVRWAALSLAGAVSFWWSLALILAIAGGLAGLWRLIAPLLSPPASIAQTFPPTSSAQRIPLLLTAGALVLLVYFSLFPSPILRIISSLNEIF